MNQRNKEIKQKEYDIEFYTKKVNEYSEKIEMLKAELEFWRSKE